MNYDAFISYCHLDDALARALISGLEEKGKRIWWDEELTPGSPRSWRNDVADAILQSQSFVLLLSERSLGREEVEAEFEFAKSIKKPLIAVFLGEILPKENESGLLLGISAKQRIETDGGIQMETIHSCANAINEAFKSSPDNAASSVPKKDALIFRLEHLNLTGQEFPILDFDADPLSIADYESFKKFMSAKQYPVAEQLLARMTSQVSPDAQPDLNALRKWFAWCSIYKDCVESYDPWSAVIKRLQSLPDGRSLADECSVVREYLRRHWSRLLGGQCRSILNRLILKEVSYSLDYLDQLEDLREATLKPTAQLLGLQLPEQEIPQFLGVAKAAVRACWETPSHSKNVASFTAVLRSELPPTADELNRQKLGWESYRKNQKALKAFEDLLPQIASPGQPMPESVEKLRLRLEMIRTPAAATIQLPDFDTVQQHREAWAHGLATIADGFPQVYSVDETLERISEASRSFPSAGIHRQRIREWFDTRQSVEEFKGHDLDAADIEKPWIAITRHDSATRQLTNGLVLPYVEYLRDSVQQGVDRLASDHALMEAWLTKLASISDVNSTDRKRIDQIRSRLNTSDGGSPECMLTGDDPLARLLDQFDALRSALDNPSSLVSVDGELTADFAVRFFETGIQSIEEAIEIAADISQRLDDGDVHVLGINIRSFFPRIDDCVSQMSRIHDCVELWRNIAAAIEGESFPKAKVSIKRLVDIFPELRVSLGTVDQVCELGTDNEYTAALQKRRWPEVQKQLSSQIKQLRQLRTATTPKGSLLSLLDGRIGKVDQQLRHCELVISDMERVHDALGEIKERRFGKAKEILESLQANEPSLTCWRDAAEALVALDDETDRTHAEEIWRSLSERRDNRHGMPLDDLPQEQEFFRAMQSAAKRADRLVSDAENTSGLSVECDLAGPSVALARNVLERLEEVQDYAQLVSCIRGDIGANDWKAATDRLRDYLCELPEDHVGIWLGFILLEFLDVGSKVHQLRSTTPKDDVLYSRMQELESSFSHPLFKDHASFYRELEEKVVGSELQRLARLMEAARRLLEVGNGKASLQESDSLFGYAALSNTGDLDTVRAELKLCQDGLEAERNKHAGKVSQDFIRLASSQLEQAAGENVTALLAMTGDIDMVFASVQRAERVLPADVFNLAVAVCAQSRHGDIDRASLEVALGVGALIASCIGFRQAVRQCVHATQSQIFPSNSLGLRRQIETQIRDALFDEAHVVWGARNESDSWACRWDVECCAVMQMAAMKTSLNFPFGPTLVQFFRLEDQLAEPFKQNSLIRRWFGPCAIGEAFRRIPDFECAVQYFATIRDFDQSLLAFHAVYANLTSPATFLVQDLLTARCKTHIRMFLVA
ncbi:MAG: toll/interleukin-1 receptor domain-containing protein, partial [Planctomycetes bacterium]|nr:toll/interleukin-1 receptor domain-containing protein [Planctomycetota bacterium]